MEKHVSILVALCSFFFMSPMLISQEHKSPEYVYYVNEIFRSFSKQVKQEFGLDCESTGGSMPYDVQEISMSFNSDQTATLQEARELEVKVTEKFIELINAHEKIRPFLREFPFPPNRATVMISFEKPKKMNLNNYVELVLQVKNIIYYESKKNTPPYNYETIKEESYEEALKIVQGKSTDVSTVSNNP